MSTNFYAVKAMDIGRCTGKVISEEPMLLLRHRDLSREVWRVLDEDKSYHLGKRSMGWQFTWSGELGTNLKEIYNFILEMECVVFSEYGEMMSFEDFLLRIHIHNMNENNVKRADQFPSHEFC